MTTTVAGLEKAEQFGKSYGTIWSEALEMARDSYRKSHCLRTALSLEYTTSGQDALEVP